MNVQLVSTLILFLAIILIAVAYLIRVWLKGQVHFDRVEQQGGSPLLGKSAMEMGYWFFQGIARILVYLHINANQVSWCSLFFGMVAGISLAYGHFGTGAILASFSAMMDSLDGLVARMTGQSSSAGEVLDSAIDRYVEFFFLGGLVIYYREIPFLQILCLVALLGSFMVSYSTAKAEALQVTPPRGSMRRPERALYLTLGAALSPISIPWLERSREFPIPIAHPMVISLGLVAVVANFSSIERLVVIARAARVREKTAKESVKKNEISFCDRSEVEVETKIAQARLTEGGQSKARASHY